MFGGKITKEKAPKEPKKRKRKKVQTKTSEKTKIKTNTIYSSMIQVIIKTDLKKGKGKKKFDNV